MKARSALKNCILWVSLAIIVNIVIYITWGNEPALEFLGGYIIELSLSVDNLFLFLIIFTSFNIPISYQKRVLTYGIIGAVILFISAFCSFYTLLAKQESGDEMSIQHILSAKSMSLEILLCSMMIVGILSVFISFPFFKAYGFFVSASQILPGLLFLKFEKEGY